MQRYSLTIFESLPVLEPDDNGNYVVHATAAAEIDAAQSALLAKDGEIEKLREALKQYGDHAVGCDLSALRGNECSCGWWEARQALSRDTTGDSK